MLTAMPDPEEPQSRVPATWLASPRLMSLLAVHQEIVTGDLDLDAVMARVTRSAMEITRADAGVVDVAEGGEMVARWTSGAATGHPGLRLPVDASLSGRCLTERRILLCVDADQDARVDPAGARAAGAVSLLCVPINHHDHTVGVLKVYARRRHAFDDEDVAVLDALSGLGAAVLRHAVDGLARDARHDRLTDLPTRAVYDERLAKEVARAHRYGGPLSLVLLDLDGFARFNERHGRPAGDAVLRAVAHVLDGSRACDDCFRIGDDEFAMLLPQTAGAGATALAERVAAAVVRAGLGLGGLTISYGTAELDVPDPLALHAAAERALLGGKDRRRARG